MKYFITFGGPTSNYHNAVNRICKQSEEFNVFDKIIGLTEKDLNNDTEFFNKHHTFIENNSRGYGYWLWKSYIVKKQLEVMNDNDILVYADAGCVMNVNGKQRLLEYFEMVNNNYGILSFEMDHLEKTWTKMDIFQHLDGYKYLETGQLIATIFIIKKCKHSVDLVNKWYDNCCIYNLIDDSSSQLNNDVSFIENRHDQSIWSIIRKKYGSIIINDETYYHNWDDGKEIPILAMRIRY